MTSVDPILEIGGTTAYVDFLIEQSILPEKVPGPANEILEALGYNLALIPNTPKYLDWASPFYWTGIIPYFVTGLYKGYKGHDFHYYRDPKTGEYSHAKYEPEGDYRNWFDQMKALTSIARGQLEKPEDEAEKKAGGRKGAHEGVVRPEDLQFDGKPLNKKLAEYEGRLEYNENILEELFGRVFGQDFYKTHYSRKNLRKRQPSNNAGRKPKYKTEHGNDYNSGYV